MIKFCTGQILSRADSMKIRFCERRACEEQVRVCLIPPEPLLHKGRCDGLLQREAIEVHEEEEYAGQHADQRRAPRRLMCRHYAIRGACVILFLKNQV